MMKNNKIPVKLMLHHFKPTIGGVVLIIILIVAFIHKYSDNGITYREFKSFAPYIGTIFFITVLIFRYQYRSYIYDYILCTYSVKEFKKAIKMILSKDEWRIIKKEKQFFKQFMPKTFKIKNHERRNILNQLNILINGNNKNTDCNLISIDLISFQQKFDIARGILTVIKLNENEWSFKNILIRIIFYPFCISLIILGCYMILTPINHKSMGAGVGIIILSSTYLSCDIRILIRKYTTKKEVS